MMKGEIAVASNASASATRLGRAVTAPSGPQTHLLFADALKRADGKPQPFKKKMAEDQPAGTSITTPVDYALTASPGTHSGPAPTDSAMAAHIERIAAAIAEITTSGGSTEIHLQLPPGTTRIDGAVVGRNDAGQMHIVLTTAAAIAPTTAAQMQSQLTEWLLRRDIRATKISVQRVKGMAQG